MTNGGGTYGRFSLTVGTLKDDTPYLNKPEQAQRRAVVFGRRENSVAREQLCRTAKYFAGCFRPTRVPSGNSSLEERNGTVSELFGGKIARHKTR